jgi:hypothetical protein
MAGLPRARVNNLNQRMHDVGIFDQDLTLEDATAINAFYGYTCLNCGAERSISLDHVKPIMSGGTNKRDNIQNLCESCNKAKGQKEIDYRKGRICPDDYAAPTAETYNKHDWDAIEHEYVTTHKSLREIAKSFNVHESQVLARASSGRWFDKRKKFSINLVSSVQNEVIEALTAENFDVVMQGIRLFVDGVERWQLAGEAVSYRELVEMWKPLASVLGKTPDRKAINVTDEPDEADILARITEAFDTGEADRSYTSTGDSGEEAGAGWSD